MIATPAQIKDGENSDFLRSVVPSVDRPTSLLYFSLIGVVYAIRLAAGFWSSYPKETMIKRRFSFLLSFRFLFLGSAFLLVAALTGCGQKNNHLSRQAAAAEAEAYKSNIELSHIGLAKGESYLGDQVYYVEGKVKNLGNRSVYRMELTFVFKDTLNQVVLRESRKALDYKGGGGLESQKTSNFQVAFDHLPKDWNYTVPQVEVSKIVLK